MVNIRDKKHDPLKLQFMCIYKMHTYGEKLEV